MNKKTFTVEFAAQNDLVGALTHEDFDYILRRGIVEYMGNFYAQNVKITFVEQTCGTVGNKGETIDLLRRAANTIASLSDKLSDAQAYALGLDIEKHLRENVQGEIQRTDKGEDKE